MKFPANGLEWNDNHLDFFVKVYTFDISRLEDVLPSSHVKGMKNRNLDIDWYVPIDFQRIDGEKLTPNDLQVIKAFVTYCTRPPFPRSIKFQLDGLGSPVSVKYQYNPTR